MLKLYCDNCGTEFGVGTRYIWFKQKYFDSNESYKIDLCERCYNRLTKHIRRAVQMYKKVGNNDR